MLSQSREFLKSLWKDIPGGTVYCRQFRQNKAGETIGFKWPEELDPITSWTDSPEGISYIGYGIREDSTGRRESVKSIAAYWTTLNLDVVSLQRAAEALKRLPVRPSVGFTHGEILHVFWFLKEVLRGEDLELPWAANDTLIKKLRLGTKTDETHVDPVLRLAGLQTSHFDFDGIFRSPCQQGVRFVAWHPEVRYGLDEFVDLLCPKEKVEKAPVELPKALDMDVGEDNREKIVRALAENWYEQGGMTLHLSGMLARAGIAKPVALYIITESCKAGKGNVATVPKMVEETYARYSRGENVTGATSLEKAFEQLPAYARDRALKSLERVKKLLPKPPDDGNQDEGPEPDFCIKKPIIKFDSRPARWEVTLVLPDGKEIKTGCDSTSTFIAFNLFQGACYEQTHFMLKDITQYRWKRMIADAEIETRPTPPEARPEGAIETALDEFLGEAREKPDVGILKTFPGYDEESRYFRFGAFKDYLKELGHRFEDRMVFDHLKRLGFNPGVKRIGSKVYRLWEKGMNGDIQQIATPDLPGTPPPQEQSPEGDLFEGEGGK